ncbi:hypothetical protein HID58_035265 [Brassica napus]|uniref:Uncharacterized protein n=1 Tax=Brassica napus TaxID=3708 RepID=A0ABQ8C4E3_BRANA|nr:hypothetical protein HID58_035265 [Brassica napus]
MEGKPEVIADKKQYGELYAILKEIQGLLRHGVAAVKISTQFSLCCFSILTLMIPLSYPRTHDLFSMMVPDAADYMGRINISDINEGHTCY